MSNEFKLTDLDFMIVQVDNFKCEWNEINKISDFFKYAVNDNTFNYENPKMILELCLMSNDKNYLDDTNSLLGLKIHLGGDVRGNYSEWTFYKFQNHYTFNDFMMSILENEEQ